MMWMPVLKVLTALAVAVVLVWFASKKLYRRKEDGRTLRSLPGSMVQDIADRLDQPDELCAFLKQFFGTGYNGGEHPADSSEELEKLLPVPLPPEELSDLIRTVGAIEPDALLAYACQIPEREQPAVVTVCRGGEKSRLLIGVFLPE
ncbi:MAG: hypothetical protein J5858_08565 [Lentisphaeria bacterium]|nr:hypothetical protein [Lentisphaeria bacterium]